MESIRFNSVRRLQFDYFCYTFVMIYSLEANISILY